MKNARILLFVGLAVTMLSIPPAHGQYQMRLYQFNIGNGVASGGHTLYHTAGQNVIGVSQNSHVLNSGWWCSLESGWSVNTMLSYSSLLAELRNDIVTLKWIAESSVELDGFHVYRSNTTDEGFVRITSQPVPPQGALPLEYRDEDALAAKTYYYKLAALIADEEWFSHAVGITLPPRPTTLYPNYPNPFNPATTISFYLEAPSRLQLSIFDVKGARVCTLVDESIPAGRHSFVWDGVNDAGRVVASGVYFCRLTSDRAVLTSRLLLLK